MKHSFKKIALTSAMSLSLLTGTLVLNTPAALAAVNNGMMNRQQGMMNPMQSAAIALADTASDIVSGTTTNSAADLTADTENATVITVSDEDSQVKISESGTYIVTGSASDGSITVKKGTTGVVLILEDLDLTSTTGAAVSVNKESEVQIVVYGSVTLTDAENPADEASEDAEVADAYDGAAIKVKAGSSVYLTGDGTLTVNGTAKNGIKSGDDASLVIDGENLTVDITAANDGINANYDLTIASGTVTISASDDALHTDRSILTVGSADGSSTPTVTVTNSNEGLEGTVVNIHSGTVTVSSNDDAINAANSDNLYADQLTYAINITGGDVTISSRLDGLDSNGDINVTGGALTIERSANNGGDAGIDYDGSLYISSDATVNNGNGIAGPDGMPGGMMNGQMPGQMGQNGQFPGNGQQMTRPDFSQNGQTSGDNQQMMRPDFNQNGQTSGDNQQMMRPDFNQNDQASADNQQMNRPDFNQENQAPNDNQQMTPPDFNQNGLAPMHIRQMMPGDFSQNGQAPLGNQAMKGQTLGSQAPIGCGGMQPIYSKPFGMNQPMGMAQAPNSFAPNQQSLPFEVEQPAPFMNERGK